MARTRQQALVRMQTMIESQGWPRVQMTLLVCLTGGVGFLTSFLLLHLGVTTIWERYLLAMLAAYLGFLFFLWLWAKLRDKNVSDGLDLPDLGKSGKGQPSKDCEFEGKGGDFGGGGASKSFEPEVPPTESIGSGLADVIPDGLELEELAIPLIILVLVATLLASSLLIIVNAPALFDELLLDGILSASLYRRLRGLDQTHWIETAIKKTALPFTTITVLLVTIGWTIQWLDPSATTIGQFISHRR